MCQWLVWQPQQEGESQARNTCTPCSAARVGCVGKHMPASRILVLTVTCCCRHWLPTVPLPGFVGSWIETGADAMDALRTDGAINSGGCIASLACGVAHSALQLGLLQVTRRSGVGAGGLANHSPCFLVSHQSLKG